MLYDIKIALNTSLALLYLAHRQEAIDPDQELIRSALDTIRANDQAGDDDEASAISYIKGLIEEQIRSKDFDKKSIMRRVKVACSLFPDVYENLETYLEEEIGDPEEARKTAQSHKQWLRRFVNQNKLKTNVGRLYGALTRGDGKLVEEELASLKKTIDSGRSVENRKIPSLVGSLRTSQPEGFGIVIRKSREILGGACFRTGFRGINRMLGAQGGIRMSELALMPALPFNGKTLFSQSLFLSVGVVNKAEDFREFIPGDKTPAFLDLSFENTQDINVPQAFDMLYGNLERKKAPTEQWYEEALATVITKAGVAIPDGVKEKGKTTEWLKSEHKALYDEVETIVSNRTGNYICKSLNKNGWEYIMDQHINTDFEIQYLPDIIADYESQGLHIMGVRGDYLGTIKKEGLGNGVAGTDIKESYRIARNVTAMKDKFALLPHQLSPDAKRFKALNPTGYVRNLPGKGFYEGCTSLDNEADLEFYFGVTEQEGKNYLEVQRGKHRGGTKTAIKDHYCVIPFDDVRILPWDMLDDAEMSKDSLSKFSSGSGALMEW